MSDDTGPDNVVSLPRIGSPPPPPVPAPPKLDEPSAEPDTASDTVRISVFDAPEVPHAPTAPGSVPAALRSDGLDPATPAPHGLPPRTGALSLAAILAIALAAFEGLQTWIQESGPRRAEAAKHQREMELLAAKATADATRLGAEADKEHARARRVPSSHEYGRNALGRASGGTGRSGGGVGPGGSGAGRRGPCSTSGHGRGGPTGNRESGGGNSRASHGPGGLPPRHSAGGGGRNNRAAGPAGTGGGTPRGTGGGTGGRGLGGTGSGHGGTSGTGGGGRRSIRQTAADWRRNRAPGPGSTAAGPDRKGPGGGGAAAAGAAATRAALRNAVARLRPGPTFWEKVGERLHDRWRKPDPGTGTSGARRGESGPRPRSNDGWAPPKGRGGGSSSGPSDEAFFAALFGAMADRWKKRRERTTGPGPTGPGPEAQARSSPFDTDPDSGVTITVEQVDPPGAHARRWQPEAIAPAPRTLPARSQSALPRAPQRPAGQRPGTTRRKDPIPMPAMPASSKAPAATSPAATSVAAASRPRSWGVAAQHATDITLDDALRVLTLLTTAGMETHDDCAELHRLARRLLDELEAMVTDLPTTHNVRGMRTLAALAGLIETVHELVRFARRTARAALAAAELAEAEEAAMARDYRPVQTAAQDAGLLAPSARIHNEN